MKVKKDAHPCTQRLAFCVASPKQEGQKAEACRHLQVTSGFVAATNGKILYATKSLEGLDKIPDGAYLADPYFESGQMIRSDKEENRIDWLRLLPHAEHESSCVMNVPEFASRLPAGKDEGRCPISLVETPGKRLLAILGAPPPKAKSPVCFDLSFLRPFAGQRVRLWYATDNSVSPVVVADEQTTAFAPLSFGWFMLVMPLRPGNEPIVS